VLRTWSLHPLLALPAKRRRVMPTCVTDMVYLWTSLRDPELSSGPEEDVSIQAMFSKIRNGTTHVGLAGGLSTDLQARNQRRKHEPTGCQSNIFSGFIYSALRSQTLVWLKTTRLQQVSYQCLLSPSRKTGGCKRGNLGFSIRLLVKGLADFGVEAAKLDRLNKNADTRVHDGCG